MQTKDIHKKNNHLIFLLAGIWLIFSCIFIFSGYKESKIYDALAGNTSLPLDTQLGKQLNKIQTVLLADQAVQKQDYEQALQIISGTKSEDYYNRWTIQMLLAYKNALQSSISWLQTAQSFAAQAQQNFTIAKQLSDSSQINNAINKNQKTMNALWPVIDIKTCYGIGQTIINNIKTINTTIESIQDILKQEDTDIEKKIGKLDTACYQKLRYIVDTSKEQAGMLQKQMQQNTNTYTSNFSDKIEDPMLCIQLPYENILPSIIKGKQWLEEYKQLHQNTIDALQSNNNERIQELCNQTKNDAQINQQIEDSVQELLQKLEDNTLEKGEQQKSSSEAQYKDLFNQDEQKILQQIQKINQGRIDATLKTRGKSNYTPQRYINEMFNQFYGNSGDFINLHK